jgi:glyoxylase-like metal-dependent hydrolase (beta-lactamase superfamily II)
LTDVTRSGGTREGEPTPLGAPARFDGGLTEIGEGAWAWLQPNGGLGESNAGLLAGEGESLLIDTLWDARLTEAMLAEVEAVTGEREAPLARLFNTHGDGDHWYGNGLLPPGVEIVATAAAERQMREEPPAMLTRLAPLGPIAAAGSKLPLLPGRDRLRGLAAFSGALGSYEFKGLEPRRPDRRFEGQLDLDVGGREVQLIEVGPAHTPGDAIAWIPDARIVFAGDIVFNGVLPIMWAGPVSNWIEALERIEALEPAVIVGGHGPPCGLDEVRVLREHWQWLGGQVAASAGESHGELAERLVRSNEWRASPWGDWLHPERTLVNVARIEATSGLKPKSLGTAERIGLIAEMGALAERLTNGG